MITATGGDETGDSGVLAAPPNVEELPKMDGGEVGDLLSENAALPKIFVGGVDESGLATSGLQTLALNRDFMLSAGLL